MQVFLYVSLAVGAAYQPPLIAQVKQAFPAVTVLDVDARSDELLLHHALRLLREADRAVVCIQAEEADAGLGNIVPVLEELLQEQEQRLVLLLGRHPRLVRIFQSRPHVHFKEVRQEEVVPELQAFLSHT